MDSSLPRKKSNDAVPSYLTSLALDGDQESLPLYEGCRAENDPGYEDGSSEVPDGKATPVDVRRFLTRKLIIDRNMNPNDAQRAAALWTIGSGRELRSYPPPMFKDIFGAEIGWVLYLAIRTQVLIQKRRAAARWLPILRILSVSTFVPGIVGLSVAVALSNDVLIAFGIFFTFVGLLLTVVTVASHFLPKAEDVAEDELRHAFARVQPGGPSSG